MEHSKENKREIQETQLSRAVEQGITEALTHIKDRFEGAGDNALAYHDRGHTKAVVARTEAILIAMRDSGEAVSEQDIQLGRLAGAYHDIVQHWQAAEKESDAGTVITRQRATGKNEQESADALKAFTQAVNDKAFNAIFRDEDVQRMQEAILVTVPGFNGKTVVQEGLDATTDPITRAVALADLGEAGMGGPEVYAKSGDALFREENLDITRALRTGEEISQEQQEVYRQRMLNWTKFQVIFAQGRQERLEDELAGLGDDAKVRIHAMFSKFNASIENAKACATARDAMTFQELAEDMGYQEAKA